MIFVSIFVKNIQLKAYAGAEGMIVLKKLSYFGKDDYNELLNS